MNNNIIIIEINEQLETCKILKRTSTIELETMIWKLELHESYSESGICAIHWQAFGWKMSDLCGRRITILTNNLYYGINIKKYNLKKFFGKYSPNVVSSIKGILREEKLNTLIDGI